MKMILLIRVVIIFAYMDRSKPGTTHMHPYFPKISCTLFSKKDLRAPFFSKKKSSALVDCSG